MEKERFMLIYMDEYVYRFKCLSEAQRYAICNCRNAYGFYVIVDLERDEVVVSWLY